MRTISIINLKGGVAKTTSSINIAYILTQRGYKVLLVDNDKQGDCSRGLNRRTSDGDGIDRIMTDRHPDMQSLIHNTDYENLDIITANLGLLTANTKVTMDRVRPQQNRLKKALRYSEKEYHKAISKPWGGKKPPENYSWNSEELKQAVGKISKIFAGVGEKGRKAIESLRNLFVNAGISLSEIPEPGNYTENTENMVHTARILSKRRKK